LKRFFCLLAVLVSLVSATLIGVSTAPAGASWFPYAADQTHYVDEWFGQGNWVYNFKISRRQSGTLVWFVVDVHRYGYDGSYQAHELHHWMGDSACPTLEWTPNGGWSIFVRTHQFIPGGTRQLCVAPGSQGSYIDEVDVVNGTNYNYSYNPQNQQYTLEGTHGGYEYGSRVYLERHFWTDPVWQFSGY